jgi:hypothetical protein
MLYGGLYGPSNLGIISLLIVVVLGLWAYRGANARGKSGVLIGILVVLTDPMGLVI